MRSRRRRRRRAAQPAAAAAAAPPPPRLRLIAWRRSTSMRPFSYARILLLPRPAAASSHHKSRPSISSDPCLLPTEQPPAAVREGCRRRLEKCLLIPDLVAGRQVHARIVIAGLQSDSSLSANLIALYFLCGEPSAGEAVFEGLADLNGFLVDAAIRGFVCNGMYRRAVGVFRRARRRGVVPGSSTFSSVVKACASSSALRQWHGLAAASGLGTDLYLSNSLIHMYARCGSVEHAARVFETMPQRDAVSWNSIISAYARAGLDGETMLTLREMVGGGGLRAGHVTVLSALTACLQAETIRELHAYAVRTALASAAAVRNALITAYGRCGEVGEARRVFDNSALRDKVSWNAMISCCAQNGSFDQSTKLLQEMRASGLDADVVTYSGIISSLVQKEKPREAMEMFGELLKAGLDPDAVAIASILPAISDLRRLDSCREMHAYAYRQRIEPDRRVRNALVSVYGKCGSVREAYRVFTAAEERDVISWSAMVAGFAQNGHCGEALEVFRQMIRAGIEPNPISITGVLAACSGVSALRQGKEVHLWAIKRALDGQTFVGSALIDMYAKGGKIGDSRRVFELLKEKNLVTWNSMIGGYAFHGLGEEAVEIFRRLEEPDGVSFISVLSACSHGGLVEEGIRIFDSMEGFGVEPGEGHYACLVDLLGRSGRLDRAAELAGKMPAGAGVAIWGSLLGASKIHCNLDLGMYSGVRIIGGGGGAGSSGYYVTLSNILAEFGRWSEAEEARELMNEKGVKKEIGCSRIEVNRGVHRFVAKDRCQRPEWRSLLDVLACLNEQMRGTSSSQEGAISDQGGGDYRQH